MTVKINRSATKIMYSSYKSNNSTTQKIERSITSFNSKLFESNECLEIIDEFYNSLREHQKKRNKNQKNGINYYIDDLILLVKKYNNNYMNLLTYDRKFNKTHSKDLLSEVSKFHFNLYQIGIEISKSGLLKLNVLSLKDKVHDSITSLDFIYEKHGLIDTIETFLINQIDQFYMIHINKKV
ncbi:hypothetical protein QUF55_03000 [Clostridiaceae bacterium HSG29]|nr:hypothetical protein [Clostridiaceae bacterium HSG29]